MKRQPKNVKIPHSKPLISKKDIEYVKKVLFSGMIAEGDLVQQFEQTVSEYLGLAGGVATSSGTAALFLGLKALNIGTSDEVIIPTYVCRSVWDAVQACGATPVLCDIGEDWCINTKTIKMHLSKKTKAIIYAHIFGIVGDVKALKGETSAYLFEDCAQAFGAHRDRSIAGDLGEICVLSFNATKCLTTGEGGMVLSKDDTIVKKLRDLRMGNREKNEIRYRYPMSDIQASLGLSQLQQYESFIHRRLEIADFYLNNLKNLSCQLPWHVNGKSIFFRFPLRSKKSFTDLRETFDSHGIQIRRGVDTLLHRSIGVDSKNFPIAEKLFRETLSIPIYPALTNKEQEHIVKICQIVL